MQRFDERNVEDAIIICLSVYNIPPYHYVHQFVRIGKKKYQTIDHMLWMLVYHQNEGEDVKENIKLFIEGKKFHIKTRPRLARKQNIASEVVRTVRVKSSCLLQQKLYSPWLWKKPSTSGGKTLLVFAAQSRAVFWHDLHPGSTCATST